MGRKLTNVIWQLSFYAWKWGLIRVCWSIVANPNKLAFLFSLLSEPNLQQKFAWWFANDDMQCKIIVSPGKWFHDGLWTINEAKTCFPIFSQLPLDNILMPIFLHNAFSHAKPILRWQINKIHCFSYLSCRVHVVLLRNWG